MVLAIVASLALGVRDVDPLTALRAVLDPSIGTIDAIAVRERIPRTVLGLLVGAALGLAGSLMQGVTRNPLADPGILGVNGGAALAVVIGIAFLGIVSPWQYLSLALVGAALAAAFVYVVGSIGRGGPTPIKLALAGAATSAALASLVSAILLPRTDVLTIFRQWQIGGIGGAEWDRMLVIAPVIGIAVVVGLLSAPALDAMALGEQAAKGLGVDVGPWRLTAAVAGVVLCGAGTALAGPIGFIGLVVPHVLRLLVGANHRALLPASLLGGAGLLLLADVVGRLIQDTAEVEAGIVAAFVGAPVLIVIARRSRMQGL
ncbi:iron ABC transporter permease [Agrococcus versicolor]|uniref:FecCD family ABC transporter permease n=1 Tax=Agrococcus versicolor TaxID=501482 RepID=UPI0031D7F592